MDASIQPLPIDPSALRGLSKAQILGHHTVHYGGIVRRLNAIRMQLARLPPDPLPAHRLDRLRRAERIATDSALLHELYFASLGGDGVTMEPAWALALEASFGSVERWRAQFVALGKMPAEGSRWVLLSLRPREGTLVNHRPAESGSAPTGDVPILALDLYEHAYRQDYARAAGAYVDVFMSNIDWAAVYARYQSAVHAASEPFATTRDGLRGRLLLDVRRAGAYAREPHLIEGARWCDPARVGQWARDLPPGAQVVVYCVYGHEVGRATALRLRAAGLDARFLRGGFEAWKAAGGALAPAPRR